MTENVKELVESVRVYHHPSPICFNSAAMDLVEKSEFDRVVKELTKWNKVEDCLPEMRHGGFSDLVLTKNSFGNIKLERYDFEFNHFNEIRYDSLKRGDGQVSEWRYIY